MPTLSVPTIIINNNTISIVPNSFKYTGGEGEINVRAASTGGGASTSVHSVNAETLIGGCAFDMYTETTTDAFIADLKARVGSNSVKAIQRNADDTSVTLSWNRQSLVNDVEREASSDGVVSFEFKGDQMSPQ